MTTTTSDVRITPKDLGTLPREVATVVCDLVNNYGVRHRVKGGHVWLYNGQPQSRPYKISPSRAAETSLDFLLKKWIPANIPDYGVKPEDKVTEEDLKALAEKVNTPRPRQVMDSEPKPRKTPGNDTVAMEDIAPSDDVDKWGFREVDGVYYCTFPDCGYSQADGRGRHLHAMRHAPENVEREQRRIETRQTNMEQRSIMLREAARVLAEAQGLTVFDGDVDAREVTRQEKTIKDLQAQVEKLTGYCEKYKQEAEDAKARLALIQEAMRA